MPIGPFITHLLSTLIPVRRAKNFFTSGILLALLLIPAAYAVGAPLEQQFTTPTVGATAETGIPTLATTPPPTAVATPSSPPTKTSLPPEILQNYDDTNGVVIGAVVLVVIILLGTVYGVRTRREED